MTIDRKEYLSLLELTMKEEQFFIEAHHRRVAFYFSFISIMFAATVGGAIKVALAEQYLLLCIGPLIIVAVCRIALDGTFRVYQRFLETITVRAKIEQQLGLTREQTGTEEDSYWAGETLVPKRHVAARQSFDTSYEFLENARDKGAHLITRKLLRLFIFMAVLLALGLIVLWVMTRWQIGGAAVTAT